MTTYTKKQGQYLAFIYYYTKVNGRARTIRILLPVEQRPPV